MKNQLVNRVWLVRKSAIVLLTVMVAGVPSSVGAKEFDLSVDDFNSRIGRVDDAQADSRDDHLDSDSYGNSTFGFSVAWDEDVWSASEPDKDVADNGVSLVSEKSEGLIFGFPKNRSLEGCVEISAQGIENLPDFMEFGPAPERYERPELSYDAAGELFVAVGSKSGDEIAFYIECREVAGTGSIILISFGVRLTEYEGVLPVWQELFDSIEIAD